MAKNKNSLANLRPDLGKKFSSEYQPTNRRKKSLFNMLADVIGEQELEVSFTKEEFYKCYQYLIELTGEELKKIVNNPMTPIWMVSLSSAIVSDVKSGSSATIEKMYDRLFGRAAQSTDITSGGEKITVNPPKIVFTDDYEDEPDNDDEEKLLN